MQGLPTLHFLHVPSRPDLTVSGCIGVPCALIPDRKIHFSTYRQKDKSVTSTSTIMALVTPASQELWIYISRLEAPFSLDDIQGFNARYKQSYPLLSREERRQVEAFIDTMIEKVDRKEWASRIFGVV